MMNVMAVKCNTECEEREGLKIHGKKILGDFTVGEAHWVVASGK